MSSSENNKRYAAPTVEMPPGVADDNGVSSSGIDCDILVGSAIFLR